ncbi:hypothetical protein BYT27DRAFT_7172701 [Phlegmacium glaucopus]|nr:hypothetical protein BYT27DRAFT_7172701 [Phlegmacium glaucopus]
MDTSRSSPSSISSSGPSADTGEPHALDLPHDRALSPSSSITRDDVFYFETIAFQVEDTLFRVFKSGFEVKGSAFEAIFSLPQAQGYDIEGTNDSNPIHLRGIGKANFTSFLRVLYRMYPFQGTPITYDEWIGALDLATMWDFKEIRKTCIEALSELIKSRPAFDNILLARKYKVEKWLRDGYVQLLQQGVLDLGGDICNSKLDLVTIAKLLYIRERKHGSYLQQGEYCISCSRRLRAGIFKRDEANKRIDEVFSDEIAGMQDG